MTTEDALAGSMSGTASAIDADPMTVEIIRNGLNSTAEQMRRALIHTAFSRVIYEMVDFACALYDRENRLLAQASGLPIFMGSLDAAVNAAVAAVGGEEALEPGDIVLFNVPYLTGSHAQDAAMVMPTYASDGKLVGYAAIKAHWLDLGAKEPYCTDTVDVFQEGTLFPGVHLYRRGELVDAVYRIILANTRVPQIVAGDLHAEVVALRAGAEGLSRMVDRYGYDVFRSSIEVMYDQGEAAIRRYFEALPDGRYTARSAMDSNGQDDVPVPFEVTVEINGSNVCIDYTTAAPVQPGPINCTYPDTLAASRIAIMAIAGGADQPCEGHLRPLQIITQPGTIFHAVPPDPCFLCGFLTAHAIEVIWLAIASAMPQAVPACSGSDIVAFAFFGQREASGEAWIDGMMYPVGQGAYASGDGANAQMQISVSQTHTIPVEVAEAVNPWLFEKFELATDSAGPGKYRGGLGVDVRVKILEEVWMTSIVDRTKNAPWGLNKGSSGRPNGSWIITPDGERHLAGKVSRLKVPAGSTLEARSGGGGGWGPAAERDTEAVREDVLNGYVSPERAQQVYGFSLDGNG